MEIAVPTIIQLKEALLTPLRKSGWWSVLRMYLMSEQFDKVLQTLLDEIQLNFRVTPKFVDMFRAFLECPFEQTKVILYTEEISPYVGRYSGIAYDCSSNGRADNQLKAIHTELLATIPGSKPTVDLTAWTKQGVLLLTSELTTTIGQKNSHIELYRSWNNMIFDVFKHDLKDCIFVLIGGSTWFRAESLHKDSPVFKLDCPNVKFPANWQSDIFRKINNRLKQQGKEPILW